MSIIEQLYRVTFMGGHSELLTLEEFQQLQEECREIAEYGVEVEDAEYESFGEMIGRLAKFLAGPDPSRQPVPWQEAIQAWADGKRVVWEDDEERRVFDRNNGRFSPKQGTQMIDQAGGAITARTISGGKWYVED